MNKRFARLDDRGRLGFTLIELLVSTALASLLTAVCISAFQQGRANIERSEARVRMHASVQVAYANMQHAISSLMNDCAVVTASTQATGPGTGDVTLVFMKGKENEYDWIWTNQSSWSNNDLEWMAWRWQAATQQLCVATSSPQRFFTIGSSYKPDGNNDYKGQQFINVDQPRRTLSATNPWADLDNNVYFPSATSASESAAAWGTDIGDWTDLGNHFQPALVHVSDFSYQIMRVDGTTKTVDDTATTVDEHDGVFLDGRIATDTNPADPNVGFPLLSPTANEAAFPGSAINRRPRLLRIRFTLTDPTSGVSQNFAFSFQFPGFAGPPY